MAEQLKAVVQITADTTGLVRGIEGAMSKIGSIARGVSVMAAVQAGSMLLNQAQRVWQMVSERSDELGKLAVELTPQGSIAQMQRMMAELAANQQIAKAIAPTQVGIEMMRAQSAREQAAAVVADADQIGAGMNFVEALKTTAGEAFTGLTDGILKALGFAGGGQFDLLNVTTLGTATAFERTGATDMVADFYGRLIPYLDRIVEKMGGEP